MGKGAQNPAMMAFIKATNVACRAWDAAMNTQPKELTWNVMGMLNNPWFTVVKHFDYAEDGPVLTFEHPTLEKTMPPPGPDTYIFCCGPPPMIKSAIAKLEALGHDPSHVLCF